MQQEEPRDFKDDTEAQEAIFSEIAAVRDNLMRIESWVRQAARDDNPFRRMALLTEANNAAQTVTMASQGLVQDIRLARSRDLSWPRPSEGAQEAG